MTAAAPIQKSRDWLEPALRNKAAKQRAAAAAAAAGVRAPRTAAPRIAGENNRRSGEIPLNKAFTSAISAAHSHPARWATSTLESAEAAARSSHAQVPDAPHPDPDRRRSSRDARRSDGP